MITSPIRRYKSGTFTITRTTAPAPVAGRQVAGVVTALLLDLSIQPATGPTLVVSADERHGDDIRRVWSETELYSIKKTGYRADKITIAGDVFEVFKVMPWPHHWECYIANLVRP
jgi:hypothetical protein